MRLLIPAGIFPPDIGGPASYVPQLATSLTERGHEVQVVCLADAAEHDDRSYPFNVVRIRRQRAKAARVAATIRTVVSYGRNTDVVYANGLNVESRCAAGLLGLPVVYKIVGDLAWERARNRGWFDGPLEAYQTASKGIRLQLLDMRRTMPLRSAAAIIAPSVYLQRIVEGWGIPARLIHVVYNALPSDPPTPTALSLPPSNGATIVTIGRLVPWKGIDRLVDVITQTPRLRLVVVGEGPCRGSLEAYAKSHGVADRVLWMGARSAGEIETILRGADVFVLNSAYEGLPHTVLEAMRAGVPVVATAVGGTPELVTDGITGRLVPYGDVTALREALTTLIDSPAQAGQIVANARRQIETRFRHTTMVDQTERVLLAAASEGRHA
jgi:glycosyltransferase involved in cell wall biosynthesis